MDIHLTMSYCMEYKRLESFKLLEFDFRNKYKKNIKTLYSNGFYYSHLYDVIQCCMSNCYAYNKHFIKNLHIHVNNYNDCMRAFHSTKCLFERSTVRSKMFCDPHVNFLYERERLNSFIEFPFPHIINPKILANMGFFYDRYNDLCVCIFCRKYRNIRQLKDCSIDSFLCQCFNSCKNGITDDDNAFALNISLDMSNILDSMVIMGDNLPIPTADGTIGNIAIDKLMDKDEEILINKGIDVVRNANNITYKSIEKRKESFVLWEIMTRCHISSLLLAEAGFYYIGNDESFCILFFFE